MMEKPTGKKRTSHERNPYESPAYYRSQVAARLRTRYTFRQRFLLAGIYCLTGLLSMGISSFFIGFAYIQSQESVFHVSSLLNDRTGTALFIVLATFLGGVLGLIGMRFHRLMGIVVGSSFGIFVAIGVAQTTFPDNSYAAANGIHFISMTIPLIISFSLVGAALGICFSFLFDKCERKFFRKSIQAQETETRRVVIEPE